MNELIRITSDSISSYSRNDETTLKTIKHKHLDADIEKIKILNKEKRINDPDGFIIEVESDNRKVTTLGFNRWMPFIEGFRKETFQMNYEGKWYRLYESDLVSELSV
jgi:hypothetical protein